MDHINSIIYAKASSIQKSPGFSLLPFGSFSNVCLQSCMNICPALQLPEPKCYSRNIDIGGFLLFQPGISFI